ncbi:WD40 repeat-like protein [Suillus hirtellus]|nr:WD40 repeat-like protein [Suillus hirtellus]
MSTSEDGSICQWQRDGEPVGKPLNSDGGGIGSMVVSPDETMVICGNADGRLRLWNIEKGKMIGDPWEGHDTAVRSLDWSPSSLEIASGSEDGTIRRWNPDTGRQMTPPIETSHRWVNAVKYSPQEDRFMSGGTDMMICVWSKYGQLLIKIKGHDSGVTSLCWSEDGKHIFSASIDNTIRKWRAIDAQEPVVFRGHTHYAHSLCLIPNQNYIVSGSSDYSIRIWDLKTNQPVGDPLFHDDELWAVAMSPDGKYIASTGQDKNIYVWSLEEALKVAGVDDGNAQLNAGTSSQTESRILNVHLHFKQQANTRGSAKYGSNFFGNESDHASRRAAPPASPSFLIRWHRLLSSIHFDTPPVIASQPIERHSRYWNSNFKLFSGGNTRHTVDVPLAQDEDRYGIVHETDAEAAAAMQRTDGNEADNSLQSGQPAGAQASQVEPIQTQT